MFVEALRELIRGAEVGLEWDNEDLTHRAWKERKSDVACFRVFRKILFLFLGTWLIITPETRRVETTD